MFMISYKQRGFSLPELLIAMVITLIVIAVIAISFNSVLMSSNRILDQGRLDRELQTITDIMANDIERAGYWKNANTGSNNPFMQTGTTDIAINAAQNCILFTYDSNGDGSLPAISVAYDDERYGYRLDDGAIQFRPYGAAFDCAAAHNNWTDLTRPSEMTITAFIVALNNKAVDIDGSGPGTNTIHYRTITMTISGQLTSDSNVKKTITRTIKVYNNKYVP